MADDDVLPIRTSSASIMARNAMMVAETLGLGRFALPIDMTDPKQVAAFLAEVDKTGTGIPMPEDDQDVYYLFHAYTTENEIVLMVIPEAEVPAVMIGMAARAGADAAYRLQFRRSLLPLQRDQVPVLPHQLAARLRRGGDL